MSLKPDHRHEDFSNAPDHVMKELSDAAHNGDWKTVLAMVHDYGPQCLETVFCCEAPVIIAAEQGQLDTVKWMIIQKADPNFYCNGKSPLIAAARKGHTEIMTYLLEHGAKVDLTTRDWSPEEPWTALMFAARDGQKHAVDILLRYGANPAVQGKYGHTPYSLAFDNGHHEIAEMIVEALSANAARSVHRGTRHDIKTPKIKFKGGHAPS